MRHVTAEAFVSCFLRRRTRDGFRRAQIYAREGVDFDRATMAEWVGKEREALPITVGMTRHHYPS